jgi:pilus assembly protein CpaC
MTSRWTGRRSEAATRAGPTPFRWRVLVTLAALLTLIAIARPDAAEISDNSLNGAAAAAPVALHHVSVTIYKSRTVPFEKPFTKAIVGSTDIVDVLPISDRTLYLQGKKLGTTNVTVFDAEGRLLSILDVEVAIDIGEIQQKIQRSIGVDGVRVSATGNQVTLTGLVPDTVVADRALAVAKGIAGDAVVNAMQVAPSQQVLLEVRFLEATRDAARNLGVNLFLGNGSRGVNTGQGGGISSNSNSNSINSNGTVTPVSPVGAGTGPGNLPLIQSAGTLVGAPTGTTPFLNGLLTLLNSNGTQIDALITALEQKGLARRLAEPNLMALSGETAHFLAGGQFPYPTVQPGSSGGQPVITTQFQAFGVQLAFVPTVLPHGVINLRVEPTVSELDFTNAVTIQGTQIPSLIVRDARTTVELRDGQSFAIAGLLQTRQEKNLNQVPWLGSVPVLGALFRSSGFQQNETDLVIIVTPHLASPAVPGQRLASPLDSRLPGNDVDFFLNGQPEVRKRYNDFVTSGGDLVGPYGYIIAPDGAGGPPVKGAVVKAKD